MLFQVDTLIDGLSIGEKSTDTSTIPNAEEEQGKADPSESTSTQIME